MMAPKDLLLALVVILAWGVNFVVIKVGLHGMPPMLLGALRFTLAAVPAVFFVRRPQISWRLLVLYGATIQLGQFVFLFTGMYVGMPAGLASLVLQSQAFFTLVFAMLFLGERLRVQNLVGLAIAAGGLVVIAAQGGRAMTLAGFLLTICSAAMWAVGNIVTKKVGKANLVSLVVWASLVPPVPFFLLSLWFEGPQRIATALAGLDGASIFAVVNIRIIWTHGSEQGWRRQKDQETAAQVAQFSLLVPIIGLASSALLLDEHLTQAQLIGAALVMGGLAVNVFGGKLLSRFAAS